MKTRRDKGIDYQALAEFRYEIRRFQILSEQAARNAGIEPQQYQAILAVKGLASPNGATVGMLAERLQIQHHSAVELVDRLEEHGLLKRVRSQEDRRQVILRLTDHGEDTIERVALPHHSELRAAGRAMLNALAEVMEGDRRNAKSRGGNSRRKPMKSAHGG